jgi:phospholipase D1/2
MQFMLQRVQETITASGINAQATDFLNFLCLGNRAAGPHTGAVASGKSDAGVMSEDNRRFMVYVHSKFMIVDDEVAIIGACNVQLSAVILRGIFPFTLSQTSSFKPCRHRV